MGSRVPCSDTTTTSRHNKKGCITMTQHIQEDTPEDEPKTLVLGSQIDPQSSIHTLPLNIYEQLIIEDPIDAEQGVVRGHLLGLVQVHTTDCSKHMRSDHLHVLWVKNTSVLRLGIVPLTSRSSSSMKQWKHQRLQVDRLQNLLALRLLQSVPPPHPSAVPPPQWNNVRGAYALVIGPYQLFISRRTIAIVTHFFHTQHQQEPHEEAQASLHPGWARTTTSRIPSIEAAIASRIASLKASGCPMLDPDTMTSTLLPPPETIWAVIEREERRLHEHRQRLDQIASQLLNLDQFFLHDLPHPHDPSSNEARWTLKNNKD
jgi:hypothetical protein